RGSSRGSFEGVDEAAHLFEVGAGRHTQDVAARGEHHLERRARRDRVRRAQLEERHRRRRRARRRRLLCLRLRITLELPLPPRQRSRADPFTRRERLRAEPAPLVSGHYLRPLCSSHLAPFTGRGTYGGPDQSAVTWFTGRLLLRRRGSSY